MLFPTMKHQSNNLVCGAETIVNHESKHTHTHSRYMTSSWRNISILHGKYRFLFHIMGEHENILGRENIPGKRERKRETYTEREFSCCLELLWSETAQNHYYYYHFLTWWGKKKFRLFWIVHTHIDHSWPDFFVLRVIIVYVYWLFRN